MRKKVLYLLSVVLASCMMLANVMCVHAAGVDVVYESGNENDMVVPCYNSLITKYYEFTISDSGEAVVNVSYSADSSNFVQAKLTVKIQKKVLGLFWKTIDITEDSDEYVEYSSSVQDILYCSVNLEDTGTYRAVITLEITCVDGSVETDEKTIECEY